MGCGSSSAAPAAVSGEMQAVGPKEVKASPAKTGGTSSANPVSQLPAASTSGRQPAKEGGSQEGKMEQRASRIEEFKQREEARKKAKKETARRVKKERQERKSELAQRQKVEEAEKKKAALEEERKRKAEAEAKAKEEEAVEKNLEEQEIDEDDPEAMLARLEKLQAERKKKREEDRLRRGKKAKHAKRFAERESMWEMLIKRNQTRKAMEILVWIFLLRLLSLLSCEM